MQRPRPKIERALRFIAEHLDEPLTTAQIARAVAMSESHLHRAFHAALGESPGRFVTRKRLETAALRLAYEPQLPITTIALSSGYSSSSNFTKAFTGFFGCSPSQLRAGAPLPKGVGKIVERYGKDFQPGALYVLPPEPSAEELSAANERWSRCVRFVESPGLHLCCLASPDGYDYEALQATWSELIMRCQQLGIVREDVDAWGVAHDSPDLTAPDRCRYHACVPYDGEMALPSPLFAGRMLPGRYAVFDYSGSVWGVAEAYKSIYSCWFRESSVTPEDFVPLDHYTFDAPEDGQVQMELWFRIKKAV